MALTFLTLTNDVITRMNEVVLTSSNFTGARGIQIQCQNAVNDAIRYVNQREFGYSFNHSSNSSTLTPGVARYAVPTDTKSLDYSTARIKKSTTLSVSGSNLTNLNYYEYIDNDYANEEDDIATTTLNGSHSTSVTTLTLTSTTGFDSSGKVFIGGEVPRQIVRTPDNNYLLYPYPDKQYTLEFDYYTFPSDLSAHGDTTSIPDRFRPVIVDGATSYVYMYRGEQNHYQLNFERFEQGIKNMQSLLINKFDYVRSPVIVRPGSSMNFTSGVVT